MALIPMRRLAEVMGEELEDAVRTVKIELFSGVISDTRVKTGRLRGNWQTTTGSPASGEVDRVQKEDRGPATSEAESNVQADTIDYLTNNLPYAEVWEERDGMVSRNVARVQRTIRELTR